MRKQGCWDFFKRGGLDKDDDLFSIVLTTTNIDDFVTFEIRFDDCSMILISIFITTNALRFEFKFSTVTNITKNYITTSHLQRF